MKITRWTPAMHAVLDGEASPEETAALQAHLAADFEARAEFERLQSLFAALAAMTPRHPPEGMVAAISAALEESARRDQPFAGPGVLGSTARRAGSSNQAPDAPFADESVRFSQTSFLEKFMNQQPNIGITHRKRWVAGGIAAIAAAVAVAFTMGGKPRDEDVNGTIVAAERYRAPQAMTQDVQLGDMSVAQLLQNDAFLKLTKDPEVQSLVVQPGFVPASRLMLDNPEAVRQALAGRADAQAGDAMRLLQAHPQAAERLLANPDANRAMLRYPDASLSFVAPALRNEADRAQADRAQADRAQVDRAQVDRAQVDRAQADRIQADRVQADRVQADRAQSDRAQVDRAQVDRAQVDRAQVDRAQVDRAQVDRAQADRAQADRAQADRAQADRAQVNRSQADRAAADRSQTDRAQTQ